MTKYEACSCENCGRSNSEVEVNRVTVEQHVAQLCLACAHVLTLPKNESRFFQLVRKKDKKQSNQDMQEAHNVLSIFLAVGTLFLVIIAAAGASQGLDLTGLVTLNEPSLQQTTDYVTFADLTDYN